MGRKRAARSTSFTAVAAKAGFQRPRAFFRSKEAPRAMSPGRVAVAERLDTVFCRI